MSYEGYQEFRCKCGYEDARDVYDLQPIRCADCGSPFYLIRSVDQTNGHDEMPWREVSFRPQFNDYVNRASYPEAEWHGPSDMEKS